MRCAAKTSAAPRGRRLVHKRDGRYRGFTLIELVSCIVILGIFAAIAAPSLFDNQVFTSRGYADELASTLRYAQRIAMASGCPVQVNVDAAGYAGWQRTNRVSHNNCAGAWTTPVMRADATALSGATPSGVNINQNVAVEFLPSGRLPGGSIAVTVDTFTVGVDQLTGRVTVQ